MKHHNNHAPPILSFYSGGGFLDIGFEMAGFRIVWSNENDPVFALLHGAGVTAWRKAKGNGLKAEIFNTKSILTLTASEIGREAFPDGIPPVFGIIGGPPCQDFSTYGNLKGFKGERGRLTVVFVEKILTLKPTFFVMENVAGLVRVKSHKNRLKKLISKLSDDYYVDSAMLNALDFGVPQFRERVFFVGVKKQSLAERSIIAEPPAKWFPWPINEKYQNAANKYDWPKSGKPTTNHRKPKEIPIELCVRNCLISGKDMKSIANAGEFFNLKISEAKVRKLQEGDTNRPSFKRLHRFKYSPTACYGNNEVHLHPYKRRRISVREALRIQGVPDEYTLPSEVSLTKKFKMIGNGVPVPLAGAIASAMKSFLISNNLIEP
jgi:DNA (cytosine-5)-methyltransferase 1